mmetsp:Transcript_87730/g.155255  ORF Transcript_87730/g.155255 Transcript_87730/m.155255 type:complete len:207 (-) Transcript_87730:56-676(-)
MTRRPLLPEFMRTLTASQSLRWPRRVPSTMRQTRFLGFPPALPTSERVMLFHVHSVAQHWSPRYGVSLGCRAHSSGTLHKLLSKVQTSRGLGKVESAFTSRTNQMACTPWESGKLGLMVTMMLVSSKVPPLLQVNAGSTFRLGEPVPERQRRTTTHTKPGMKSLVKSFPSGSGCFLTSIEVLVLGVLWLVAMLRGPLSYWHLLYMP